MECHELNYSSNLLATSSPKRYTDTVEPLNNGYIEDECFVHCSDVVPSSEVEMYGQYIGRGRTACPL